MGFTDSFKKVIGLADIDDDEILTEEELRPEKTRSEKRAERRAERKAEKKERRFAQSFEEDTNRSTGRAQSYGNSSGKPAAPKLGDGKFTPAYSSTYRLLVIEPKGIEECNKLVDSLKARKPIIVNLENLETETARQIFHFLSGATYALSGTIQKVTNNIYIFAPENVNVSAQQGEMGFTGFDQIGWR